MSPQEIVAASAVLFFAYLIRGITGFGSGLIAVPLLAHRLPLQMAVPVVMCLDFMASFILGGIGSKQADWREIRALLPFGLAGALFGVFALLRLPSDPVLVALGMFAMFFGGRNLLGLEPKGTISRAWAVPTGLIGSSAGALFGTSAPPYIIYLTHRLEDKSAVRATFSWLFVIDGGVRIAMFLAVGLLLQRPVQFAILGGLLPMLLGLALGNRTHVNLSPSAMVRIVGAILLVTGASLVIKVV